MSDDWGGYVRVADGIGTVGDLKELLEDYDDDLPVRVNDDGQAFTPTPRERGGDTAWRYLEL